MGRVKICFDVETTGFCPKKNDVIQLAAVEIIDDYQLGREFNCYMAPERPQYWTRGAEAVHGMSLEFARALAPRREGIKSFMKWLAPLMTSFPLTAVFHGKNLFDYIFLRTTFGKECLWEKFHAAFSEELAISTWDMAREAKLGLKDLKLSTLAQWYGVPLNHHEAASDARATAHLYLALKRELESDKRGLFEAQEGGHGLR